MSISSVGQKQACLLFHYLPSPLYSPMSMSDNLTKLAHKIDFTKTEDGNKSDEEAQDNPTGSVNADSSVDAEAQESKDPANAAQDSPWPWEFVRNKLRYFLLNSRIFSSFIGKRGSFKGEFQCTISFSNFLVRSALTEICVLGDVLNIAKEKRYMVLDQVSRETPEPKRIAQMLSKKKVTITFHVDLKSITKQINFSLVFQAMAAAAAVLLNGTERLRNSQSEMNRNRNAPDFHMELLRLRQNWHLKKVGSTILGDLSYKTGNVVFKSSNFLFKHQFICESSVITLM